MILPHFGEIIFCIFMKINSWQNLFQTINLISTKRFIDELYAKNDGGWFGRTNAEIYSKNHEFKAGYQCIRESFLNVDINIVDSLLFVWKFAYKLCDKRDSFLFLLWGCHILIVIYLIIYFIQHLWVKHVGFLFQPYISLIIS